MLHSFCRDTLFCTTCGKSAGFIVESGEQCREGLLAINHKLAKRRGTWTVERLEYINRIALK